MSEYKDESVRIIQIAPVYTNKYRYMFGLGDDSRPYVWSEVAEYWELHTDEYQKHIDWLNRTKPEDRIPKELKE